MVLGVVVLDVAVVVVSEKEKREPLATGLMTAAVGLTTTAAAATTNGVAAAVKGPGDVVLKENVAAGGGVFVRNTGAVGMGGSSSSTSFVEAK